MARSPARYVWGLGPALAVSAAIFWLSHQSRLPSTPGGDKLAHLIAYSVVGFCYARGFALLSRWPARAVWLAAAVCGALYGLSDEWHQSFVPGRSPGLDDALADAIGSVLGAVAALPIYRRDELAARAARSRT
jgi:VanZ family protein